MGDFRTYLALRAFIDIVSAFTKSQKPPTLGQLAHTYELTESQASGIIEQLLAAGMIHAVAGGGFVPSKEFSSLTVRDALNALEDQGRKISAAPDDFTRQRIREIFECGRRYTIPELDSLSFAALIRQIDAGEKKIAKKSMPA